MGKTSIFQKYSTKKIDEHVKSTIGLEYNCQVEELTIAGVDYKVKAKVWDTAGQERYRSVTGV